MNAQEMSRVYGYIRASTDKQIASPATQQQIIEEYARRLGRSVDRYFIDPAVSGKKSLFERDAGKELSLILKKDDEVIVARLDRLSRSFVGFAKILEFWLKHKIRMHLCDMPGGVFDPDNPMSEMLIGMLIVFANYERRLISVRTREGLQARKQRGEKYCRWAEYGWRWEKRFDSGSGKHVNVKVVDEGERAIMAKCVELRAAGCSRDKIRQHLNYELKARTRLGGHWTNSRIDFLVQQGLRLMAETQSGTKYLLASVDEEEEYDDLVDLEDESDD
jgi:DNA invertase Pin-like site-specific DNA recombinase